AHGWHKVRIAAHKDRPVAPIFVGIFQHLQGNVDVSTLFLNRVHAAVSRVTAGRDGAFDALGFVVAQNDVHEGAGGKRSKVNLLVGQSRTSNESGKVVDLAKVVMRSKQSEKPLQVQPLIRSA